MRCSCRSCCSRTRPSASRRRWCSQHSPACSPSARASSTSASRARCWAPPSPPPRPPRSPAPPGSGSAPASSSAIFLAMVHGFACITHRGNQVVSGMALNIMVAGLAPTLAEAWFGQGGRTPLLGEDARFQPIVLPFAEAAARRADPGPDLCRADQQPQHPGLCDGRGRAAGRLGGLSHALRPAPARGRREPERGRHRRHQRRRGCATRRCW